MKDVASCDIYIGIFAWRYGFIPEVKKENPNKLSITELEYRKAKEIGISCLIFLLDDKMPWPLCFIDGTEQSETNKDNINRLRKYFKNSYITSFFKSADNLASLIVPAVNNKLKELHSDKQIQTTIGNETSALSSLLLQKPSLKLFKGEKSFFVGRGKYINEIIKEQIKVPASKVCIVGPGGSGKSQLAFKAIHRYEKEGLFDLVIPVHFSDVSSMSFSGFLLNIADSFLDKNDIRVFENMDIEDRIKYIQNFLYRKNHPLLFLNNYETISYFLNDRNQQTISTEQYDEAVKISFCINNELPSNTSVLVTSRERNNNFDNKEKRIDLEGLHEQETLELFSSLTSDDYLKNINNIMKDPTAKSAISKIFNMTGGHPLSIEIIAKNTTSIHQINQMADTLALGIINTNEPEKRLRSLQACFEYTISRISDNIKNLLYNLTIFKSPFPNNVAEKIFNENVNSIIELQNRSLLLEIKSETSFGEMNNPEYWLYNIHPAIRNYLERTIEREIKKTTDDLEKQYSSNFYKYYDDMLWNIFYSIGTDVHRSSLAKFNLIYNQGTENNDFDRAIEFARYDNGLWYCANISRAIGRILESFGMLFKALDYHKKAFGFSQQRNDENEQAVDYKNIGLVYDNMGNYEQALEYHNKSLEIDTDLNDRVELSRDYKNIGVVYNRMGNYQQALEHLNKALEINTELNDRVELVKDHYNMSFLLYNMNEKREDALEHLSTAKTILLEFEKETGYRHPFLEDVENRILELEQDKK